MAQVDWSAVSRDGSRALNRPTGWVLAVSGGMVALLFLATLPVAGAGGWILRIVAGMLAVPVVLLAVRRHRVLTTLAEIERTGAHPDDLVRMTSADGTEIEVIVDAKQRGMVPRVGVTGLAALSLVSLVAGGLAFGLVIIVALALVL